MTDLPETMFRTTTFDDSVNEPLKPVRFTPLDEDADDQWHADGPLCGDLRPQSAFTATPPQNCLNGCRQGTGDARGPVPCQPGHYLCSEGKHSCLAKLDRWLRDIPDLFALLLWVKDRGTVPGNPENAQTKQPDAPAPMRLEVSDLLDDRHIWTHDDNGVLIRTENRRGALGIIHDWARRIRAERLIQTRCHGCQHETGRHKWAPPLRAHCRAAHCHCPHYETPIPTVAGECSVILTNLAWCTQQEWAGDMHREIKDLARILADTVGDYRVRPVGKCAAWIDRPGAPLQVLCGGALVMDRDKQGVVCLGCGKEYAADAGLRELGLIVGAMFGDDVTQLGEAS